MSEKSILIRAAGAQEVSLLCGIIHHAYLGVAQRFGLNADNCPKHPSNCTVRWIEDDMARGVQYYVMEADERAVGCAALEVVNESLCYLERLAVLPEDRKQGFGRQLVEHLIGEAERRGIKKAGIGIIAEQHELMRWYREIGFEKGEAKHFPHLPFTVLFMTYRIE